MCVHSVPWMDSIGHAKATIAWHGMAWQCQITPGTGNQRQPGTQRPEVGFRDFDTTWLVRTNLLGPNQYNMLSRIVAMRLGSVPVFHTPLRDLLATGTHGYSSTTRVLLEYVHVSRDCKRASMHGPVNPATKYKIHTYSSIIHVCHTAIHTRAVACYSSTSTRVPVCRYT